MQDWIVLGDVIREQLLKFNFLLTSEMTLNDKFEPRPHLKVLVVRVMIALTC